MEQGILAYIPMDMTPTFLANAVTMMIRGPTLAAKYAWMIALGMNM